MPGGERIILASDAEDIATIYYYFRLGVSYIHITYHQRGETIGEGGDTMISSPGKSPKQPLPEIGLHDPLHGRQACPEFIAFDQGVGQICLR